MGRMVVIYNTPRDPAAFDAHYFAVHVPLAKKLPGLRRYEVSKRPMRSASLQSWGRSKSLPRAAV